MLARIFFLLTPLLWATVSQGALEPPVLRLSMEAEPSTLDWHAARSPSDRFVASFLMRGLLKYDAQAKPVCDLCKSYVVSPDRRGLTFVLDAQAEWSDGTPVQAQQFVDSFRR